MSEQPKLIISKDIDIRPDLEDGWLEIRDHLHYSSAIVGLEELDLLIAALQKIQAERLDRLLTLNQQFNDALKKILDVSKPDLLTDSEAQYVVKENRHIASEALAGAGRANGTKTVVLHEIDISDYPLDEGIADLVFLLRENGFNTFTSCQGGEGHAFDSPTIRIDPLHRSGMEAEAGRLAAVLSAAGYAGYYIKICRSYQQEATPWGEPLCDFIELEFWAEAVDGD